MNTNPVIASALLLLPTLGSCSSLEYGDPEAVETVSRDYGSTDKQTFAAEMVDSLVRSSALNSMAGPGKGDDQRVIVYMGGIQNRTSEHIDTGGISDSIKVLLLKSGKFRFVASDAGQTELGEQVRFQQDSGRVDPTRARAFGKQLGADVVVLGTVRSIESSKGRSFEAGGVRTDDVYYQFVLECVNIESGETIWAEEKELRKTEKTGIFG
jgi:hypothetical protein